MRVKNWDYRELRARIADGYTLRQFTAFRLAAGWGADYAEALASIARGEF